MSATSCAAWSRGAAAQLLAVREHFASERRKSPMTCSASRLLSLFIFKLVGTTSAAEHPHLFTTPQVYQALVAQPSLLQAKNTAGQAIQFLTREDVQTLSGDIDEQAKAHASSLWDQRCEIPRVDTRLSLRQFARRYKNYPAVILSAETGIGKLPFRITPDLIASLQPEGALTQCLCRPEHGTNFQDRPADTSDANVGDRTKRYCLWQLPLFARTVLSNATETTARIDHNGQVSVDEHELLSNPELAKSLLFQCRVGAGNFHSGKTTQNKKLVQTIAHSLGKSKRNAKTSWWNSALDDEKNFDSATLWLSSNFTRTPLHADAKMQFLVQLQGTKHVTLLPASMRATTTRLQQIAASHGGAINATLLRAEMSRKESDDEMQQCLLRPGEVMWMQPGVEHDVFALDASISLNIRFNQLASGRSRTGHARAV